MEIQTAQLADVEGICQLLQFLFQQEADFSPAIDKQMTAVKDLIKHPEKGHFLVVKDTQKVIGCVSLLYVISTAEGGKVALLEDMVIDPTYRGSGVGKKLLEQTIQFATEQNCKRITLLTDQNNHGAQRFYQQAGFTKSAMLPMRRQL